MRLAVIGALATLVASSVALGTEQPQTRPADRAVFTADDARRAWSRRSPTTQFWTPGAGDVRAFERELPRFLRRHMATDRDPRARSLWNVVHRYKRQYYGLVEDGRRLIKSSFFCAVDGDRWRRERVVVFDGGLCYFHVAYDVDRRAFFDMVVNGEA